MRLFKISIGHVETYAVGTDVNDVFQRKAEYDPTFDYLPVVIEEVIVEGYEIIVSRHTADDPTFDYLPVVIEEVIVEGYEIIVSRHTADDPSILKNYLATTDKTELKAYLKLHDIEFVPQWGEERLRELALQHYIVT